MKFKYINSMLVFVVSTLLLPSCAVRDVGVMCPKLEYKSEKYCIVPFVEMQANYVSLDGLKIAASGVLKVMPDSLMLIAPYSNNFDLPQPYNVVELTLGENLELKKDIKMLDGKYVQAFGFFRAENKSNDSSLSGVVAHLIEAVHVVESFE